MDSGEITVTMSLRELEMTLNALAQLPFAQVNGLLANLVSQANVRTGETGESPAQGSLFPTPEDVAHRAG